MFSVTVPPHVYCGEGETTDPENGVEGECPIILSEQERTRYLFSRVFPVRYVPFGTPSSLPWTMSLS